MGLFNVKKGQHLRPVVPPFLATGTSSVEDNFSTVLVRADSFCFTHHSPPAVKPRSEQATDGNQSMAQN